LDNIIFEFNNTFLSFQTDKRPSPNQVQCPPIVQSPQGKYCLVRSSLCPYTTWKWLYGV